MKSFSLYLRILPVALAVPPGEMLAVNISEMRLDITPCSIETGDMTAAPPGQYLFTWRSGEQAAIPENAVRSIVFNE